MPWSRNPSSFPDWIEPALEYALAGHTVLLNLGTHKRAYNKFNQMLAYIRALESPKVPHVTGEILKSWADRANTYRALKIDISNAAGERQPKSGKYLRIILKAEDPEAIDIYSQLEAIGAMDSAQPVPGVSADIVELPGAPDLDMDSLLDDFLPSSRNKPPKIGD